MKPTGTYLQSNRKSILVPSSVLHQQRHICRISWYQKANSVHCRNGGNHIATTETSLKEADTIPKAVRDDITAIVEHILHLRLAV